MAMPKRTVVFSEQEYTYFYTNTFVTLVRGLEGLEIGRVYVAVETLPPCSPGEEAVCSLETYPDRKAVLGFFPSENFRTVHIHEMNAARTHLEKFDA
jgi:hypothetical protein